MGGWEIFCWREREEGKGVEKGEKKGVHIPSSLFSVRSMAPEQPEQFIVISNL